MAYVIEYERVSGEVEDMPAIFPTTDDAMGVAEDLHRRYAPTEKFARFSILDSDTREVYADYEC